jgi:hypothetical protein
MSNSYLPFLKDDALLAAAQVVYSAFREGCEETDFEKNSLDAFGSFFETCFYGNTFKDWINAEKYRQLQKTLQNAIGTFHQVLLGSMPGCVDTGQNRGGIDILNPQHSWIAEVKNKHNTVKGSDRKLVYDNLAHYIGVYENKYSKPFTAFYVEVIPKGGRSYNEPFQPTDNLKGGQHRPKNDKIRIISGPSFYDFASGHKESLLKILLALPSVMHDKMNIKFKEKEENLFAVYKSCFEGKPLRLQ